MLSTCSSAIKYKHRYKLIQFDLTYFYYSLSSFLKYLDFVSDPPNKKNALAYAHTAFEIMNEF